MSGGSRFQGVMDSGIVGRRGCPVQRGFARQPEDKKVSDAWPPVDIQNPGVSVVHDTQVCGIRERHGAGEHRHELREIQRRVGWCLGRAYGVAARFDRG